MQRSGLLLAALLALLAPVRGEEGRRERPRGVSPCPVGLGEGPLPALRHGARGSRGGRGRRERGHRFLFLFIVSAKWKSIPELSTRFPCFAVVP